MIDINHVLNVLSVLLGLGTLLIITCTEISYRKWYNERKHILRLNRKTEQ